MPIKKPFPGAMHSTCKASVLISALLLTAGLLCSVLSKALSGQPASVQPSPTFYQLIPFEAGEYGYTLSVVSDSSIWFSTNRGVYHYNG